MNINKYLKKQINKYQQKHTKTNKLLRNINKYQQIHSIINKKNATNICKKRQIPTHMKHYHQISIKNNKYQQNKHISTTNNKDQQI